MDGAHIDWWRASAPEVEAHFGHQTPQQPTVTVANGDPFLNNPFNMNLLAEDEEDDPLFAPVMPDPLWIDHGTAVLTSQHHNDSGDRFTRAVARYGTLPQRSTDLDFGDILYQDRHAFVPGNHDFT